MKLFMILFLHVNIIFAFNLADLQKSLKVKQIDGNFTQIKNIKNFYMPFKSSGNFNITNSKELIWQTQKPINDTIKINKDGIFTLINNDWVKTSKTQDIGLFLDLLSLNTENLNDIFKSDLKGDKNSWTLTLIPKNNILKQIFHFIKIKGDTFIRSLDINETKGDFSSINFLNLHKINE